MTENNLSRKYFLSPHLFFLVRDSIIIVWDYKNHQQYEIEKKYFDRLLDISSSNSTDAKNYLDRDLIDAGILIENAEKPSWSWDILSQIFHVGTSMSSRNPFLDIEKKDFINEYVEFCEEKFTHETDFSSKHVSSKEIYLPSKNLNRFSSESFLDVLKNRKTCRSFSIKNISIEVLSELLFLVFSDFNSEEDDYRSCGYKKIGMRKTSPSAGGLHPTEVYVFVSDVHGLEAGTYYYCPKKHKLYLVRENSIYPDLKNILCGQHFYENTAFGIFLTSRFDKMWNKYPHSRAYRVALMDVGHISQTFQLAATALGMRTWLSGAFYDEMVRAHLNILDTSEYPLLFISCGYSPDNSALDSVSKSFSAVNVED